MTAKPTTLMDKRQTGPDRRIALITGAAGAMGAAIARQLAADGLGTVLVDIDGQKVLEVATDIGAEGLVIEADLASPAAADEIMTLIDRHLGRLDHLVNNAGLNLPLNIFSIDAASWDAVMAVNLRAPMLLAKGAIRFWQRQGGGTITNIGSRVWLSGAVPAYTASKAGIVGLTRSFAVELAQLGVRANVVAPSYVDTQFTRMDRSDDAIETIQRNVLSITPVGRIGIAQDIADAVSFLVSERASFITGEVLHVCGGAQLAAQSTPFTNLRGR